MNKKANILEVEKLDNPTWYSLTEIHQKFCVDYCDIKFYQSGYCPFGGFVNPDLTEAGMDTYSALTNNFYIVGNKPRFTNKVRLNKELVCNQMVLDKKIEIVISETINQLQTTAQKSDLFDLVNLVQPGYFKIHTSEMGNYYGIYKEAKLVAAAGERMKMNGYTEISEVVTHPENTGRAYAKQLIAHASNFIFREGKIPYLHVADTNTLAINLYEKLGFRTRRKISFWNFTAGFDENISLV